MLKNALIGIVGLCAVLAVIGLLLPRTARVERSIEIVRPPAVVFAVVTQYTRGAARTVPSGAMRSRNV